MFSKSLPRWKTLLMNRFMYRPLFAGEPEVKMLGYSKEQMWEPNLPEVREQAVRMVFEHQGEFDSQSAAIISIAPKVG